MLAGAGSGVTPYRAFVEQRVRAGDEDPVVLLQSARTPEDLLFLEEFRAWSDAAKAFTHVPTVTSDAGDWSGRRGRIDADLLREAVGDPETVHVFACGPGDFVDTVLDLAADLGVPPARRLRERY